MSSTPPARGGGQDQAQAVDVGPRADFAAVFAELLGGDEAELAREGVADDGRMRRIVVPRDAEVDDHGLREPPMRRENVVGRKIAHEDAGAVRGGEAFCEAAGEGEPLPEGPPARGR